MTAFPDFRSKHKIDMPGRPVLQDVIDFYQDKLPAPLLEEWKEVGWCSYSKGFIWLVNPLEYKEILEDWIAPSEQALVFARTAFGDLLLWHNGEVKHLYTQYARLEPLVSDISFFFEFSLCDNSYLNTAFDYKVFHQALKNNGQLEESECYGLEPVLALGGSGAIDTIKKLKINEYLSFLSQVAEIPN
jgi:hypothetical protein